MDPHEKLDAWQAAHQLALEVYAATERWPREERFELTTQVPRAALSVPTNIAEGVARLGPRELRRFLNGARGAERSYLVQFARARGVLDPQEWAKLHGLRPRWVASPGASRGMSDPP